MDYRMYKPTAAIPAGTNVIDLIKQELRTKGIITHTPFRFIGFEATAGTSFSLNNPDNKLEVPSCGSFITPFNGERGSYIYSLIFDVPFSGNIYYVP